MRVCGTQEGGKDRGQYEARQVRTNPHSSTMVEKSDTTPTTTRPGCMHSPLPYRRCSIAEAAAVGFRAPCQPWPSPSNSAPHSSSTTIHDKYMPRTAAQVMGKVSRKLHAWG